MKCGAIDIGTNSCRLLIADRLGETISSKVKHMEITRIGAGAAQRHAVGSQAVEKTVACLQGFYHLMQTNEVECYRAVATSALREANNRSEVLSYFHGKTGLTIDVISGEEEAALSYTGVIKELPLPGNNSPVVVDLGGGSTEFIWREENFEQVCSLPLGAVRASEENYDENKIRQLLKESKAMRELQNKRLLVMVGGTAATLIAIKFGLKEYNSELVHGQKITRTEVESIYRLLAETPLRERRRLPGLQPQRADIIPAGALIILMIMDYWDQEEMLVSESDILEGIIWGLNPV